jgi:two-component system, NarL family, sensor kinase
MRTCGLILLLCIVLSKGSGQSCDSVRIKKLRDIVHDSLATNIDLAYEKAMEAYHLAAACDNRSRLFYECVLTLTSVYYYRDLPDSVIALITPIVNDPTQKMRPFYRARFCHKLSSNYILLLQLEKGLKYGLEALKHYEALGDTSNTCGMLVNIAGVYQQQSNFKQADNLLRQAEKLAIEMQNDAQIANVYNTMGILYAEHDQLDSAEKFFSRSTLLREKLNDRSALQWNYNNLGGLYVMMEQYDKAILYLEKALQIFRANKNYNGESAVANNLGEVYIRKKDFKKALQYLSHSRDLYTLTGDADQLENLYTNLSVYYDRTGDLKTAFMYSDSLIVLKDSLHGKRLDETIAEMQTKFDVEKKNLQISAQKAEIEVKEKQNKIKNIIIASVIGLTVLLALLGLSVYRRKQLEHKAKLDAEMLKQQELRSKAVIEAEEKERVRIARELHDGIGQQLSAAKLNVSALQSVTKTDKPEEKTMLQNAVDLIDESIKEVRAVSHSMMPNALIKSGLVSAVREFINKISSTGNLKVNLEIVGLSGRLENTIETVLFRVLQELVNNIIKHAKATEIGIQLIRHENELTVLVEDNGIGFDVEKMNSEGGGIGLKNIQSRIAYLNGEVIFDSYLGKGTTVTIEVPLKI